MRLLFIVLSILLYSSAVSKAEETVDLRFVHDVHALEQNGVVAGFDMAETWESALLDGSVSPLSSYVEKADEAIVLSPITPSLTGTSLDPTMDQYTSFRNVEGATDKELPVLEFKKEKAPSTTDLWLAGIQANGVTSTILNRPSSEDMTSFKDFSVKPCSEFIQICDFLGNKVIEDNGIYLITRKNFDLARDNLLPRIKDPVQHDFILGAMDKMERQGYKEVAGHICFRYVQLARLVTVESPARFEERAKFALANPFLRKLDKPESMEQYQQFGEFLVRYFTDPVFETTINQHVRPPAFVESFTPAVVPKSGTVYNTLSMVSMPLEEGWKYLHSKFDIIPEAEGHHQGKLDAFYGNCVECSGRIQEINNLFRKSYEKRHGAGSCIVKTGEITECTSNFILEKINWEFSHYFIHLTISRGPTLWIDPWPEQRNDHSSIFTSDEYEKKRHSWFLEHDYGSPPVTVPGEFDE